MSFAENPSVFLPLVPLDGAVILPGMSVTLPVTTEEESEALSAAADGRVVLVPRSEGRFSTYGTIALIEGEITLPGGMRGVSLQGLHRAELGPAQTGGNGLRVRVTERPDPEDPGPRAAALAREYRAVVEEILEARGRGAQVVAFLRGITHPGRLADTAGYSPEITFEKKVELLETLDVVARPSRPSRPSATGWRRGPAPAHPRRGGRGDGEDAAGVPAAPPDGGHPEGAGRGR